MTAAEQGLLLLCCPLPGDEVRPLTLAQVRKLSLRANAAGPGDGDLLAQLQPDDLRRLGYDDAMCVRICTLLDREIRLERYLQAGIDRGITPVTRLSPAYPVRLRRQLGLETRVLVFMSVYITILTFENWLLGY